MTSKKSRIVVPEAVGIARIFNQTTKLKNADKGRGLSFLGSSLQETEAQNQESNKKNSEKAVKITACRRF